MRKNIKINEIKMNKKSQMRLSTGLVIRLFGAVIDVVTLPFLIVAPANPIAIISFSFGNFLLVLGGLIN